MVTRCRLLYFFSKLCIKISIGGCVSTYHLFRFWTKQNKYLTHPIPPFVLSISSILSVLVFPCLVEVVHRPSPQTTTRAALLGAARVVTAAVVCTLARCWWASCYECRVSSYAASWKPPGCSGCFGWLEYLLSLCAPPGHPYSQG